MKCESLMVNRVSSAILQVFLRTGVRGEAVNQGVQLSWILQMVMGQLAWRIRMGFYWLISH
jgi:hypothetical protein